MKVALGSFTLLSAALVEIFLGPKEMRDELA